MKYSLAASSWDESEKKALQRVIDSDRFTMGKEVEEAEAYFAEYFGSKYAVMCNSGSSANLLAVGAMVHSGRWKRGGEILVPAVSWATTYYPINQYGLKLRFVDIDKDTLNIDIDKIEKSITEDTVGILTVNLLGNPNDFDSLKEICSKYNLTFLEDNCESMGATFKGRQTGTFGIMGTYSTFFSHHISTMEGGFVVTDDRYLYDLLKCLRAHGWTRQIGKDSELYTPKEDEFYELFNFILPGYNFRPMEMQGALAKEQLKKLDKLVERRSENARYFIEKFSNLPLTLQNETGNSSWFGLSFLVQKSGIRDELAKIILDSGIECRPIVAGNFVRNKVIEQLEYSVAGELENADNIHFNGIFLGNHGFDLKKEIDYAYEVISDGLKKLDCM